MPQTGATRRQKFLKSEKSKTKLKTKTKDLPKGTNVTKTNFKVKKIVIREQLKKHGETEALSTRKLNIKELLSRLNHFNTHSRTDALSGIKELISSPQVLEDNLGDLVHGITPLILNIEKNVRHEALKVLDSILSNLNIEKIEPFFGIMCTYLRSAMTHIDGRIQDDSLLFLDSLLIWTPNKVAEDFHKIIPNFLDMISKLRVDSKPGRTLIVNLGSQITSVKWRVKVLHRLRDYLHEFVKYNNIQESVQTVAATQVFDPKRVDGYSLFNPIYIQPCKLSCFSSKNLQDTVPIDEVEKFMEYTDTLMPLLFETWLEVCPNVNSEKNIETVVSEDAAALLNHTLEVISSIWDLVKYFNTKYPNSHISNVFSQKYRQSYLQYFVNAFPYVTNIRSKQRVGITSKTEDAISDPKLVAQNLQICHLFIVLNLNINIKNQKKDVVMAVLNYIEKTFSENTPAEINDVVTKIMHTIFSNELNNWTRSLSVMDALFKKIVWTYFNKNMSTAFRQKIFSLLCKIALNEKLIHFHESEAFNNWLQCLPDILLESEVSLQTINIIHMFAVRNNDTFCAVIRPKLLKIIENLPNLAIPDDSTYSEGRYKLFSMLYYIKKWDPESLNVLEKQLLNNAYKYDHVQYILDTLRIKMME